MEGSFENFESLQALLRLKRHEQPPPRYFNEFSRNVVARIRAGEARSARRWWECFGLDIRPAITVGAAVATCAMLLATLGFGIENDVAQAGLTVAGAALVSTAQTANVATTAVTSTDDEGTVSTKPVVNNGAGIMNPWRLRVQPASFRSGR